MRLFEAHGIPVPKWKVIERGTSFPVEEWGPIVVVKPVAWAVASFSKGVEARLTAEVRFQPPEAYPEGHPGSRGPMIAQRFIDTGRHPAQIRVLTLFGTPLYAEKIASEEPQIIPETLTADGLRGVRITPTTGPRTRAFVYDADVLDLARRVYAVAPDVPLQACDILRESRTGELYVLEFNPGGNTWHFSSRWGKHQVVEGRKRDEQFGAFDIAARVLSAKTMAEAE